MKTTPVLLLILTIMFAAVSGCGQIYTIAGVTVDGDGNPIGSASIYLYPHGQERQPIARPNGTSEDNGAFEAGYGTATGIKFFQIVVSKAGFKDHQQLVEANAKNVRIVLERLATAAEVGDTIDP